MTATGTIFRRPLKQETFYMRLRLADGTDTKRRIGPVWKGQGRAPAGFFDETSAKRVLDEHLGRLADPDGVGSYDDPLLREIAAEYLAWNAPRVKASTQKRYAAIIDHDLLPAIGDQPLSLIGQEQVAALHDDLSDRLSPSSINQTRVVFMAIYRYARKARGYSGPDWSVEFDRARTEAPAAINFYSPTEVETLARAASTDQDSAIFLTAGFAGLRRSEVRALAWRDVDFENHSIIVRSGYTDEGGHSSPKSGKTRSVPMIRQVAAALQQLVTRERFTEPDDLVFCTDSGGVIDGYQLYRRFIRASKRAGLRRLRFHDLRHTFASVAVQVYPLTDVQAYLGHASVVTTNKYVHHKPHTDAAKKLGEYVSN